SLPPSPSWSSSVSLHDALPIFRSFGARVIDVSDQCDLFEERGERMLAHQVLVLRRDGSQFLHILPARLGVVRVAALEVGAVLGLDRKSTRLNSSHRTISYAVFC